MLKLIKENYEVDGLLYSMYENQLYKVIISEKNNVDILIKNKKDPDLFMTKSGTVEVFIPARVGMQIEEIQSFITKVQIAKKTALEIEKIMRNRKRNQIPVSHVKLELAN